MSYLRTTILCTKEAMTKYHKTWKNMIVNLNQNWPYIEAVSTKDYMLFIAILYDKLIPTPFHNIMANTSKWTLSLLCTNA